VNELVLVHSWATADERRVAIVKNFMISGCG